jgi:predicted nucleic acid-binding protein
MRTGFASAETLMAAERFALDTNVLVYAVDTADVQRNQRAVWIVERAAVTSRCILSLQNIGEFYAVVTRKGHLPRERAVAQARDWTRLFRMAEPSAADVQLALGSAEAGQASYWDALLLATLGRAGCRWLLSEDMKDGALMAGVTVRNPFTGVDLPDDLQPLLSLGQDRA